MKAKHLIAFVIRLALVVLFLILAVMAVRWVTKNAYDFGYRIFTEKSQDTGEGKDVVVLIRENMSEQDLAELMVEKGLAKSKWLFLIQYKLTGMKKIESGTYTLNTSMTTHDIAVILSGEKDTESETETEEAEENPA
ncbi:MAG: endolytic transglycosylase MltG [Lachnospiraceae bacterium]|nr:endolytic transglycosylase MltG [Lachnospiraceae bacterium]MBQ7506228.1 endolytic transglycosylase MltG [Lachnospiraceae bacterium]